MLSPELCDLKKSSENLQQERVDLPLLRAQHLIFCGELSAALFKASDAQHKGSAFLKKKESSKRPDEGLSAQQELNLLLSPLKDLGLLLS